MAGRPKIDLGLTGYDELFMDDAARAENRLPRIYDIPLSEIDEFPDHPFQVRLDEDMDQLVQSIRERGLITPVTLRQKDDGRYEIVSGHRRCKACELAGMDSMASRIATVLRDIYIRLSSKQEFMGLSVLFALSEQCSPATMIWQPQIRSLRRNGTWS